MVVLFLSVVLLIVYYIYHVVNTSTSYWANKGIKGPKPLPIFGNFSTWLWTEEQSLITVVDNIYKDYPDEKVVGVYFIGQTPTLILKDAEIIKTVLIKDFNSFTDRGTRLGDNPITKTVFSSDGDEWRMLRQKLTPIFTTGKLKGMIPLINSCSEELIDYVYKLIDKDNNNTIDINVLMKKYALKSITSLAFGLNVDTFADEPTEFEIMTQQFFAASKRRKFCLFLQELLSRDIMGFFNLKFHLPEMVNFFRKLVSEIIKEKEGKQNIRNDFIDYLIELREQGKLTKDKDGEIVEFEISDDVITAQSMSFYGAGFEPTSSAMYFMLFELAKHPDIQSRCCDEIDIVMKKYNGKIDYDSCKELRYLSMALDETLRKYPGGSTLFRECVEDSYTFKDIKLTIKKGTKLLIPRLSLHRDPKYYSKPEKFDPERFSSQNKEKVNDCYLPFGGGPRTCIAIRFVLTQLLLSMAKFLHHFKVKPCEKTPKEITLDPNYFTLAPSSNLWLNIERRKIVIN